MTGGIVICGANGCGKTTLAKALAERLGCKHMDIEDYCFEKSDNPYAKARTEEEARALMLSDIRKHGRYVLSCAGGDMGEAINATYRCVVYLSVPLDIRMRRVRQRAVDKFGTRVLPGGDMYEQEQRFFDYVAARSMEKTEEWLKTLPCPVIYADGTKPIEENAAWLAAAVLKGDR